MQRMQPQQRNKTMKGLKQEIILTAIQEVQKNRARMKIPEALKEPTAAKVHQATDKLNLLLTDDSKYV